MARFGFIEFYYSTKHKPVDKYKCDNANVLNLLKSLEAKGVETMAIDLADNPDPFNKCKDLAAETVVVTGTVMQRNGLTAVDVTDVKSAK